MKQEAAGKAPCAGAGVGWLPWPTAQPAAAEADTPEQAKMLLTLGRMIMKGPRQRCNKLNAVPQSSLMQGIVRHREYIHGTRETTKQCRENGHRPIRPGRNGESPVTHHCIYDSSSGIYGHASQCAIMPPLPLTGPLPPPTAAAAQPLLSPPLTPAMGASAAVAEVAVAGGSRLSCGGGDCHWGSDEATVASTPLPRRCAAAAAADSGG